MQLHVLAIGTRMPKWVEDGVNEYSKRMPAQMRLQWREIKAEPRTNTNIDSCRQREAQRLQAALPNKAYRVLLDETGTRRTTAQLAQRLAHWQQLGQTVALIVGGPDGVGASISDAADETLRLSDLTLPHPLVRIVLAEQLYRASTILENHPYHRQ